ncbi:integrase arm-type DNA-binding domain-containing protein, partial [Xenorhabdus cabanillasii]
VSLADARAKRDEAKKLIAQGIDPKAEKKRAQSESKGEYPFEHIAREWHASKKQWSKNHSNRVLHSLEN